MIVKNESKIITRFFDSVLPFIDGYCICDTGSTDETQTIIQAYFKEKNIPGKLVEKEFVDFATNRNYALSECHTLTDMDYVLLLDADMKLRFGDIDIQDFKTNMTHDSYFLYQGNDHFFYKNLRIVRNSPEYSYWGVTHEYMNTPVNCKQHTFPKSSLFIHDIGDGGAKDDKYARDIRLLKKGLEDHPKNERYLFYLANSYMDSGQYQGAIDTYKQRIYVGGWKEEVWFCYYSIGRAYKALYSVNHIHNVDYIFHAIYYWLEAYQFYPERIENLYEIVKFYREQGKHQLAYQFYMMADYQRTHHYSDDHLFHEKAIYDYKLDYELSIIGFYVNPVNMNLHQKIHELFSNKYIDESAFKNVLSNYKYYTQRLSDFDMKRHPQEVVRSLCCEFERTHPGFSMSTPSVVTSANGELIVNVRFVNYRIDNKGAYINENQIVSHNMIYVLNKDTFELINQYELQHNSKHDGLYVGLEDVKLFPHDDKLLYICNRGIRVGEIQVERGAIGPSGVCTSELMNLENKNMVEKNWVLFYHRMNKTIQFVYNWYPLQIGTYTNESENEPTRTFNSVISKKYKTPLLFRHVRGSTNGIYVNDELWFICHVVSYEERRRYYHMVVVLDPTNEYRLKKYSQLFTFDKQSVEYTTGFAYDENKNEFLIGYSTYDKSTNFVCVHKEKIDTMFI
jgi:hypothetical protein